jgi:hypothetical protein
MVWRFRGSPHYLDAQGDRLGLSKVLVDRARLNAEIHRVAVLVGQLCERYHRAHKNDDGTAATSPQELAQIRGTLGQAEIERDKLHALAAAAEAMIDESHRAFGLKPPQRTHRVACDFDTIHECEPGPADLVPIKLNPQSARKAKA